MRTGRPPTPILYRFAQYLELQPNGCWLWTGARQRRSYGLSYGVFKIPNGTAKTTQCYAHRVSYELFVADIPAGLTIDHICRNAGYVNPNHLRVVTQSENSDGGFVKQNRAATHCPKGHPYDTENTQWRTLPNGNKGRACSQCKRDYLLRQRDLHNPHRVRRPGRSAADARRRQQRVNQ